MGSSSGKWAAHGCSTFLERLETVEQNYGWSILLAAAAAIGLFEWRVKGENKSLMRFSALGTSALGLFLVVIVMTVSLVVTFCLATPELGPMVRPWAVEQVASIDAAIDGIEQARVKKDWDTMQEQAEQASARQSVWHADRPSIPWWVGVHRRRCENCETMCTPRLRTFGTCKKRFAKRTRFD